MLRKVLEESRVEEQGRKHSQEEVWPLSAAIHSGICPKSVESFVQWNFDFSVALAEVWRGFYELGPELEHILWSLTFHIFPPSFFPSLWSEIIGKHSRKNTHHSFNPEFICNMLSICNVNFIVLNKEGMRKNLKKWALPFRAHGKIAMCETDNGIKWQLGAIRQWEWWSNSHLSFCLILCKNAINYLYVKSMTQTIQISLTSYFLKTHHT